MKDNRAKRTVRVRRFEEYDHTLPETAPPVPPAFIQELLQKVGIGKASSNAIRALGDFTGQYSLMLAKQSLEIARSAGRTEVLEDDLLQAYEGLKPR